MARFEVSRLPGPFWHDGAPNAETETGGNMQMAHYDAGAATHQHMILIASEQLWPNLHALVHWSKESDGLGDVHILHTDNQRASALPARRLHALLKQSSGTFAPFRYDKLHELREVGTQPQDVAKSVSEILEKAPQEHWVVVANGGLKTMTLGLLDAMANPKASVVYSEIGGGWQQVDKALDGKVETTPMSKVDAADMDVLPVRYLVETQHVSDPQGVELVASDVDELDVTAIARRCMTESGWDWRAGFEAPNNPLGPLFEKWCGALLRQFRVRNLVGGLTVSGQATQQTAESDLLCIHRGSFFYFELKLIDDDGSKESLVEILRKATSNCVAFGGYGGVPVLLLPNWRLTEQEKNLFSLFRPKPRVLDAAGSGNLISWLAKLLGEPEIPGELAELEKAIAAWMKDTEITRAFGKEHRYLRSEAGAAGGRQASVFANLNQFRDAVRFERGQNWVMVVDQPHSLTLQVKSEPGMKPPANWECRGEQWETSCKPTPETMSALRQRFESFVNRNVPAGELVAAWEEAMPTNQRSAPSRSPAKQAYQAEYRGIIQNSGQVSGYSFEFVNGTPYRYAILRDLNATSDRFERGKRYLMRLEMNGQTVGRTPGNKPRYWVELAEDAPVASSGPGKSSDVVVTEATEDQNGFSNDPNRDTKAVLGTSRAD